MKGQVRFSLIRRSTSEHLRTACVANLVCGRIE
jgi:hypothetical protein